MVGYCLPVEFLPEYICKENLVSVRGENGTMAKTKIDRITEKFTRLVIKLEVMARDTESVRSVYHKTLSDAKHNDLRSRDGYLYAARSMSTKISMAIMEHAAQNRKRIEAEKLRGRIRNAASCCMNDEFDWMPQMLTVNRLSRSRIDFPICGEDPELAADEAFQPGDLIYIIGVNEISSDNERLLSANIDAIKKKTFRVLDEVARKYEEEIGLVRIKGPKINGTEAYIYHGNVLRLVANYMEEQALHKLLYPPHGHTSQKEATAIVSFWNGLKRGLYGRDKTTPTVQRLDKLGFFDNELVYTPNGLTRRPMSVPEGPKIAAEAPIPGYEPELLSF